MTDHYWGDGFEYFSDAEKAADYIGDFCVKWGRIPVTQTKEKYGTVRVYCTLGTIWGLHGLLKPNYCYYQWPKWTREINSFFEKVFNKFSFIIFPYHKFIYNMAYWNALKKWPHIRGEILCCADHLKYIKGVTRVEGNKTHVLDWDGEIISTWERLGG